GHARGTIDVSGTLDGFDIAKTGNYLPTDMPEHLRHWLSGALVGGTAHDMRVRLKGDLAQFPFRTATPGEKPKGEFSVSGRIENGALNYTPGVFGKDGKSPLWPLMEEINGTISFDRTHMEIHARSARSANVAVSDVKAVVPDLMHEAALAIDGTASGALQDLVRFVNDSPVSGWIGKFTEETKATGTAKLALKLQMPLSHLIDTKVQGELQFANNNIVLQNVIPQLSSATGRLDFNEKGFTVQNVKAMFLGGPVTVTGGTQRDGNIQVNANGTLTADGVKRNYGMPSTQRSTDRIAGSTRYSTVIRVRNKRPEIVVESNLQGVTLDFPAPLRKAANESLPLRFELNGLPSNDPNLARDELRVALGSAISARYERQKPIDGEWRVLRGGIGVNVPAPQPDSGVIANVNMRSLDLDAWRRAVATLGLGGAPAASDARKGANTLGIAQYIDPEVLAARATELIVGGKKLDNVVVGASHQRGVWQANIDSEQASGYVTWNQSQSGQGLGRVTARLASLIVPKSAASDVTDLLEGKNTTTELPAIDLVAENLELFSKKFGHTELLAYNTGSAAAREWRIGKLSVANPDGELRASGKWTSNNGDNLSTLNYTLNILDAGRLLDRFGFANVLKGGKGKMEGQLNWNGQPFAFDIPSLSGQVNLDLAAGQFLKVDPGAGKLIGVLSLQALPRRLSLDFRDVFSEGIAFDGITANASINQGVLKTDNFKMRGVTATVLMDGTTDIARETQNLHVVVIPEINAGAASVVYGLAVNPVIGVGTFLAQLFLRDPLMKAFTFELQVTGPWKDPVVTKLQRNRAPTPTSEAAADTGPRS
ncbi:TIGR02099 family protein, partial [Oxalobacteraceae bacterium OM1]